MIFELCFDTRLARCTDLLIQKYQLYKMFAETVKMNSRELFSEEVANGLRVVSVLCKFATRSRAQLNFGKQTEKKHLDYVKL
jgi:hypothetical protein